MAFLTQINDYSSRNENSVILKVSDQINKNWRELINLCHFNCFSDSCPLCQCDPNAHTVGLSIASAVNRLKCHRGLSDFIRLNAPQTLTGTSTSPLNVQGKGTILLSAYELNELWQHEIKLMLYLIPSCCLYCILYTGVSLGRV